VLYNTKAIRTPGPLARNNMLHDILNKTFIHIKADREGRRT
jgi:hypothetical protein